MRKVIEFRGNTGDALWAAMGAQTNALGVERHGQSCFLTTYPVGTDETRKHVEDETPVDKDVLDNDLGEPGGPIDLVAQAVMDNFIQYDATEEERDRQYDPDKGDQDSAFEYDGLRAGAGWIYAAIMVAKTHGCTQADVSITSNDGNLYLVAWDRKLGALVTAVHHVYYGT